jgi:hypothetical protein
MLENILQQPKVFMKNIFTILKAVRYQIHPYLFALYAPLTVLTVNFGEVELGDAARTFIWSLLMGFILHLFLSFIFRNSLQASLMATACLFLFFSYGHIYEIVKNWQIGGFVIGRHRYLLPMTGIVGVGVLLWLRARLAQLENVAKLISIIVVLAILPPAYAFISYQVEYNAKSLSRPQLIANQEAFEAESLPNIYYIILDGYGRGDILQELYDYDNSGFIKDLEDLGFFVSDSSNSNYAQTTLSMASTFSMNYVNELSDILGETSRDKRLPQRLISDNPVFSILDEFGYELIVFESGWPSTELRSADIFLSPNYEEDMQEFALLAGLALNEFEGLFIKTTTLRGLFELHVATQNEVRGQIDDFFWQKHRMRVLHAISTLTEIPEWGEPYFVFAHIISPHPPFIFGRLGEEILVTGVNAFQDSGCCTEEEYITGYTDQLEYISKAILIALEDLIQNSTTPPIIILQSDHGPAAFFTWDDYTQEGIRERFGILNSYYFPDVEETQLYETISPVNTFRVLLNAYFDIKLDLLPDRSYFSAWKTPYRFEDVTDLLH